VKFLWQPSVCCFGLSHTIVSDKENNFASKYVVNLCSKYKITHRFSSPTTHKATASPISAIAQSSIACARVCARRTTSGWKNYPGCFEHIEPQSASDGRNLILSSIRDRDHHPVYICMSTLCIQGIEWDQNAAQLCLAQDQSEERRQQAQICIVTY